MAGYFPDRPRIAINKMYRIANYYSNCIRKLHQKQIPQNWNTQFNVHGPVHRKNILIHIQQDATLHSLFYLETALHVLGGTTTHHQERKQLYLKLTNHK
jgi:hypothetical protein